MTLDQHSELQPLLVAGERAGLGSLDLRDRLLTLPTHSHVHARDVDQVVDALVTVPNTVRGPVAALQAS